ncbi:MAG TPA: 23S rRNA (pseudouridine(1915)-N(3))-methyltransferase RlmH [Burkholderiales bacterium]|nr:23S rRNA (pseudouridine(1915)-N(3))-methyltransferase RlmH [Burkholderiales bacterium]
MRLHLLTIGRKPPAWVAAGFEDYARRMPRELPIVLTEIRPGRRDADSPAQRARARSEESARILAAVPSGSVKIALDERGQTFTTVQFAHRLEAWMREGRDLCFIVGGADGLDERVRNAADLMLSLSALTLPHALVRIVLAEQLYRAATLIRSHPYHRK